MSGPLPRQTKRVFKTEAEMWSDRIELVETFVTIGFLQHMRPDPKNKAALRRFFNDAPNYVKKKDYTVKGSIQTLCRIYLKELP